jgi:hypothetical protein
MIQGNARERREASVRLETQLGDVQHKLGELGPDTYVVQAHSEVAKRALDLLCKQRSASPKPVRQELPALARRVTEGDLRHATPAIRAEVYYWTARVHATQPETLDIANHYLEQLRQASPSTDRSIIEALVLEAGGDADDALRILRDIGTPDGRATLFGTLVRTRGAEPALSWFDNQIGRDEASFLTGLGWSNVAVSLANMGRWEEAADRLAAAAEHQEAWPELVFFEGIINVAMLFPNEWRQYALETNPCYTKIQPIEGPVWRVNIRTMAEEMLPKRRERTRWIERELLRGTIPLHAAAHEFHQPLSRLLIDLPRNNADQPDGRNRTVVPIISGARQPVRIEPSWAMGVDVSSLMALHHLGLLKKTIDALHRVMLAPDTMVLLLSERRSVRFHQPSLMRKAEEIRALIDRGDLKIAPSEPTPPAWLVDEVGRDLAQLLEAARVSGGRVVYPSPVHKLSTFGEAQAEIREYAECLVSTIAFTEVLHIRGLIDSTTYDQARQFLQAHDRDPNPEADPTLLDRPLNLDDLALGYLQEAGVLQTACRRGLTLLVHPSTQTEQSALIEAHREENRLAETLDELRIVLRDAIESGKAIFLPRQHVPGEETPIGWLHEVPRRWLRSSEM